MAKSKMKTFLDREPLGLWIVILLVALALIPGATRAAGADDVISPRLKAGLPVLTAKADGTFPVWVYFQDRDLSPSERALALNEAERSLNPRTAARRAKVAGAFGGIVDDRDLAISPSYLEAVTATGARVRERSRWLNAASFDATPGQLAAIAELPFVRLVDAVAQGTRKPMPEGGPLPDNHLAARDNKSAASLFDYGQSLNQTELANIIPVHDEGYTGAGVIVGFLDSGFRTTHISMAHLDIIATYDFVNDDTNVDDEPGDPDKSSFHGTSALSVMASFSEGNHVGPAFNASVILAKTEDIGDEQPIEEDYWVAGLEWVESLGADIVSSSLGYYYWYDLEDLDGNTCVTTVAADMAVARGLLVITSAGNERGGDWGTVTAPADGDSVIAVGGTYDNNYVAYFSSPGPTADGRIKPDIMAQGRTVSMVKADSDSAFSTWAGTSFACPIVSGVSALLLEKHPGLTPMQVREALRQTADRADAPDNDYGWGMVNAEAALSYFQPQFAHTPLHDTEDLTGPYVIDCTLFEPYADNPLAPTLMYRLNGGAWTPVPLSPVSGDQWTASIPGQPYGTIVDYYLTADNDLGETGSLPGDAPGGFFGFRVDLDEDSPVIVHTPLLDWPGDHWAPTVGATVTDNVLPVSVTVDWSLAGLIQTPFPLIDGSGDYWAAEFPTGSPVLGDTVTYTITAVDGAGVPNETVDGPHTFVITGAKARVLLVDDTTGGLDEGQGPAQMRTWMDALGYDHHTVTPTGLLTEDLNLYQVMILSGGDNDSPESASDPAVRAVIRGWSEAGGRMFVESGDLVAETQFWDVAYSADVLKVKTQYPSNAGYFVKNQEYSGHPVLTNPHALGNSMVVAFSLQDQDTGFPVSEADPLYSPYSYPGTGGVIAYDGTPAPQGGHLVYITCNLMALWASANPDLFFENAMDWLSTVEPPPTSSLAGMVNSAGVPDAGATVTVGRFYETTTASDGSFSFPDMYGGTHRVRVSRPGFETIVTDIVLADGQHVTDQDFVLLPVESVYAENDTVTTIPGDQPLGVDLIIDIGPEYAGKTVADIKVTVDVAHQDSGQLILKLTSPSGTVVHLWSRSGGGTPDIVGTFGADLEVDGPGSLDDFLGEPMEGTWRLNASDVVVLSNGTVDFWALEIGSTVDVSGVENEDLPTVTMLKGNVPNPFNPVTRIDYDIARDGRAKLAVYDLKGRLVRTLVEGRLAQGRHFAMWDGRDGSGRTSASGVYFYRLTTETDSYQGKMLLVK